VSAATKLNEPVVVSLLLALSAWIAFGLTVRDRPARDGDRSPKWTPHLALLGAGVVLIAYAGVEVAPLRTAVFVLAGTLCLIGFLILDGRRDQARLLPRRPFSLGAPGGSALVMILSLSIATIAITAYGPLLIVALHGASALRFTAGRYQKHSRESGSQSSRSARCSCNTRRSTGSRRARRC